MRAVLIATCMLSLIAPALSAQDKEKSVERKNAQQEYDALAKKYQDAEPAFQTLGLIKVDNMARLRASVSATQFGRLLADPDFRRPMPLRLSNVRGTTEAAAATWA